MQALRIIKYNEVHEDAASRRVKHLNYVQFPVRRGSLGWKTLNVMPDGRMAKGAYTDLCEFSATCPVRGVFATEQRPYSLAQIATLTDIPLPDVEAAVGLFMHDDIMFCDWIDWPIDPRLILVTTGAGGRVLSRVIQPYSVTDDGDLIDYEGNLIDSNGHPINRPPPISDHQSDKPPGESIDEQIKPPDVCAPIDFQNTTKTKPNRTERNTTKRNETGEIPQGVSDSGSAERLRAWATLQIHAASLLGRRKGRKKLTDTSKGYRADETCLRRVFDDVWPEDGDGSDFPRLLELVKSAGRSSTEIPMAWLQDALKREGVTA